MELLNDFPLDSLSELLQRVQVHSTVYCLSDLQAPWGFHVESSAVAKFHLVLEGSCVLTLDDGEQVTLDGGDLVLMPSGQGHAVRHRAGAKTRPLDWILASFPVDPSGRLVYGGAGRRTRLVCGGFQLVDALPAGLLALLPQIIQLDAAGGLGRWLDPLFGLLREEAGSRQPGASAVFAKLADVFLAQTLRSYLVGAHEAGLVQLAPLGDPVVSKAVDLLQRRSHEQWTLADLAREVGTSRTALTTRFRDLVGDTPISYLTKVRLIRAAGSLTTTDHSVGAVAHRNGYQSEASFSKAFKREFGASPGAYRRRSRATPILIDGERSPSNASDRG